MPAIETLTAAERAAIYAGLGLFDANPRRLPKTRQGFARVRAGLGSMKILAAGDSTTAGIVGGTGTNGTTASWSYAMFRELVRRGVPARYDSLAYGQNPASTGADARLTVGSGWGGFGGYLYQAPGNLTSPLTFVPTATWDRVDIYYYDSGTGTLRIQINSETAVDTALTGSSTLKKITVNATALGANTLNIYMSNGFFYLADCYASTVKDVRVINMGFPGAGALISINGGAFSVEKLWASVGADLCDLNYGLNDYAANNPSGYLTNMTTAATALQAVGDLVLNYPTPSSASEAVQDSYFTQLKAIAVAKSCNLIDLHQRYGLTKAEASANGWVTDNVHPTQLCYDDQGTWKAGLYLGHD